MPTYTKSYTYDLAGNRTGFTLMQGSETIQELSYTYDTLNRLSSVSMDNVTQASYTYDTNGNRASLSYPNGVTETYTYNLANWVTGLTNSDGTDTLSSFAYTYYASGNRMSETDYSGKTISYIYDGLGRLTQESETNGSTIDYSYDAAGNRTQMTVTGTEAYTTAYTYDANNRLLSETKTQNSGNTVTSYTYDANGNTLSKIVLAGNDPAEVTAFSYNRFNQLTSVTAGGGTVYYAYNASGIRTAKLTNGVQTSFLLDGGDVVAEAQNDVLYASYLRGVNLICREQGSAAEYYLFDAHADVIALTDETGAVTKSYDYDAFGCESSPDPQDLNPFRYCGEYFDVETGSYYLRARYYAPTIGRFFTEDSLKDGVNWYTYAGNNPVIFIDPSGQVYIIAWSYGSNDVKSFESYYNIGIGSNITADGDTSDWTEAIWEEFNQKSSFARAAYTRRQELLDAGIPEAEIIIQRIDNKEGLAILWNEWSKLNVVEGLDFYSHGYSGGAEVYRGSGDFWDNAEKLSWGGDNSYAKFYGCNTANGEFAQNFANTQGVITYGQTGYSNFSSRSNRYTRITTHGTSHDVYMGVYNRFLGIFKTKLIPMKPFAPQ